MGVFGKTGANPVRYERSDGWWVVSMPDVEGALTQGRTKASALANLRRLLPGLRKARAQMWRRRFATVRKALREAELLRGNAKTAALVVACRALDEATADPPVPWRKAKDGSEWRVFNTSTRAYDQAERRLELLVSRAIGGGCPACFAMEHEPQGRPRRHRVTGRSSKSRGSRAR
jgi:hypothetical protein